VVHGMKMMVQIQQTQKETSVIMKELAAETKGLKQSQKAFLDSFRKNGGNGRKHSS
jgi:predicted amino acid-binding ACT domain protein